MGWALGGRPASPPLSIGLEHADAMTHGQEAEGQWHHTAKLTRARGL
jgi:hypothetical protein